MSIYVQGEIGKSFGHARRTPAEAGMSMPTLTETTLGIDALAWTIPLATADGAGADLPELNEIITLWNDDIIIFRGWSKSPTITGSGSAITASVNIFGAGWWLEQEPISNTQTDPLGMDASRTSYMFPEGHLDDSIRALFARAIAIGLPVQCGDLAVMMTWPQITLSSMSFAAALAELMRPQTDCAGWWDYTAWPPAFRVTKRDDADAHLFTVGVDLATWNIIPQDHLSVSDVDCVYVDRLPDGRSAYNTLSTRASSATAIIGTGNAAFRLTSRTHGAAGNGLSASLVGSSLSLVTPQGTIIVTGCDTAADAVDAINSHPAQNATLSYPTVLGPCNITSKIPGPAGNGLQVTWLGTAPFGAYLAGNVLTIRTPTAYARDLLAMANGHPVSRQLISAELRSGLTLVSSGGFSTVTLGNANDGAAAWVAADLPPGSDGSGTTGTVGSTPLAGGTDFVVGTPGTRQVITVSGPELDTYLPLAQTDIAQIQTLGITSPSWLEVWGCNPQWFTYHNNYSGVTPTVGPTSAYLTNSSIGGTSGTFTTGGPISLLDEFGNAIAVTAWDRLIVGDIPDWLTKDLGVYAVSATISGWVSCAFDFTLYAGQAFLNDFMALCGANGFSGTSGGHIWWCGAAEFTMPITIVNTVARSLRTIFRKSDYTYFRPPATLAADLAAAQGFLPYTGTVQTPATLTPDFGPWLPRVINVAGSLSAHATMRALVKSSQTNLYTGSTRVELGAPQRLSFAALAQRIRRTPQDNIQWLR